MPCTGRYHTPSSASETNSSYDDAREVEGLLSILSPNPSPSNSYAHTPEGQFQALAMSTSMDTEMPGGIGESSTTRRSPDPPTDPVARYFEEGLGRPRCEPPAPGGSGTPGPTAPAVTTGGSTKKHIKKPEDFTDTKDWETFKHQEFLYCEEYRAEFADDHT